MKKLKTVLLLSVTAFSFLAMAEGDTPAPQRPDLSYSHGHTGGFPEYTHGEPWGIADSNTGAPSYDHGRPPAPQKPDLV
ncbi:MULTISPECIES: hypothetical protein [Bacillus cereus group]|uniref:hypothetical protein n=1 Tax=Bacillus cereus group TaxID=86661 RepID=UPI000B43F29E|nr:MULTISPECIES: hypothetical protein [Bacillus cereus group]OTX37318.1 hypothetical protein BK717_10080 [Bacillus thuringiensis serovar malayensis]OUB01882.1 hypothetical protein BK709_28680 [Bacillus thuringiensis serovar shandongiensis]MBX0355877.1 hypothetical protein [Bacillus toyonensis]MDH4420350.1 hypothetical protein [Bacillus cereus]MDM5256081.1 hypothetical protein [Bacillus toyonensis]